MRQGHMDPDKLKVLCRYAQKSAGIRGGRLVVLVVLVVLVGGTVSIGFSGAITSVRKYPQSIVKAAKASTLQRATFESLSFC